MTVELLAICDAATDYQGRLNILGVFEGIAAPSAPVIRDRCSIVTRMRFSGEESGPRELAVRFRDAEGSLLMEEMRAPFSVKVPPGRASVVLNMVLNINKLNIATFGVHEIALFVDETLRSSIPFTVARRGSNARPGMDN